MYMNVQFKNKKKEFIGREYSYELAPDAEIPETNAIIRLTDENYNYLCNGTRVRVNSVTKTPVGRVAEYIKARYVRASLDD